MQYARLFPESATNAAYLILELIDLKNIIWETQVSNSVLYTLSINSDILLRIVFPKKRTICGS
jgi:hypothetical protein